MIKTNSSQTDKSDQLVKREEKRLAALKMQDEKNKRFKLVAKIISWETISKDSASVTTLEKVTEVEWSTYRKHILEIATSEKEEKVKQKLNQTFESIKSNKGFAKN